MPPHGAIASGPKKKKRRSTGPVGAHVTRRRHQTVDEAGSTHVYNPEQSSYNKRKGRKRKTTSVGPAGSRVTKRRYQTVDEEGSRRVYPNSPEYNKKKGRSRGKGTGRAVHAILYEDGSIEVTGPRRTRAIGNVGEGGPSRGGYGTSRQYGPTSGSHRLGTFGKKAGVKRGHKAVKRIKL